MAKNAKIADATAEDAVDAITPLLNTGYLRIYSGAQAADPDTAIGAQVLLAELRFGATAFGAAVDGVATANALTADSSANATGTATWFRALSSNGTTAVLDGSVGTSDADLVLSSTSIVATAEVDVTAFTLTLPLA